MISVLFLIILLHSSVSHALTLFPRTVFEAAPFEGKILDAETGLPISNAVIYMNWPKTTSTFGGSNRNGVVEVQEALSDSTGHYKMAGWKKTKKEVGKGWFLRNGPKMVIYASGYWPTQRFNINRDSNKLARKEIWKSDMDGKTIELKPIHSEGWNYIQWQKYNDSIRSYLSLYFIPVCGWLKIPNYYLFRDRIKRKSYRLAHPVWNPDISTNLSSMLTRWRPSLKKECGIDPKTFFLNNGMTREEFDGCCSDDLTKRTGYENKSQFTPVYSLPVNPDAANANRDKR